jgi:hypothetical protein
MEERRSSLREKARDKNHQVREVRGYSKRAQQPIFGIVITPDAKTYSFANVMDGVVVTPQSESEDYLVFSGTTIETGARYSPGAAFAVTTLNLMAHPHKNDIDYYRVSCGVFMQAAGTCKTGSFYILYASVPKHGWP